MNIGSDIGFGAIRQLAITWANVDPDLYPHLASVGHNELIVDIIWLSVWVSATHLKIVDP